MTTVIMLIRTSDGDNGAIAGRPLRRRSMLGKKPASINAMVVKNMADQVAGVRLECPGFKSNIASKGIEARITTASRMWMMVL